MGYEISKVCISDKMILYCVVLLSCFQAGRWKSDFRRLSVLLNRVLLLVQVNDFRYALRCPIPTSVLNKRHSGTAIIFEYCSTENFQVDIFQGKEKTFYKLNISQKPDIRLFPKKFGSKMSQSAEIIQGVEPFRLENAFYKLKL